MTVLAFGAYEPDKHNYQGQISAFVQNVIPKADGYGPWKAFAPFAAPLAAGNDVNTKVLLQFDGTDTSTTITDTASALTIAHTWTAAGNAQIDTADFKFGGASLLLDGTGDWVSMADNVDVTLGAGPFTIEGFFKCTKAGGTLAYLAGQCDSTPTAASTAFTVQRTTGNFIQFSIGVGAALKTVTGTTQFTDVTNTGWHHYAGVVTGGTLTLWIDGASEGTPIALGGSANDSTNNIRVGAAGEVTTTPWVGWLDSFRISNIARYTMAFTPTQKAWDLASNGVVRGIFYARKLGTVPEIVAFQCTATRVFQLNNASLDWIDISKGGIAYSPVPNTDHWQAAQFGNIVIWVQANTIAQKTDISSGSILVDLGGPPPQARYIAVVNRFVVLSGLLSNPNRIQWSGLNAIETWTSGVSSSDFQDFPDGGVVRGVAGGEYGVVFQDGVIRSMIYAVGSAYIFQFIRIAEDKGLLAPYSIIRSGSSIYFLASQGFHKVVGSTVAPIPIGKDKVDATFFADYDQSALQMIIGASDPQFTRVYTAYKSQAGAANTFDKILVFDYVLEQWSVIIQSGEFISTLAAPGATLESLDAISGSIDALT